MAAVSLISKAGPARETPGDGVLSWTHTLPANEPHPYLLSVATIGQSGGNTVASYTTKSLVDDHGGSVPELASRVVSNLNTGALFLYGKALTAVTSDEVHSLTQTFAGWAGTLGQCMAESFLFRNVDSVTAVQQNNSNSNTAVNAVYTPAGLDADDLIFSFMVCNTAISGASLTGGSEIHTDGASATGYADFLKVFTAPGAASVTFATTSTAHVWSTFQLALNASATAAGALGFWAGY